MMGRDLGRLAEQRGHEVWATDVEHLVRDPADRIDVTDFADVRRAVGQFEPDIVFHLAAMTHVDDCERRPDDAWLVNAVGTRNLALHCRHREIPLVYISTGSVFDGSKPVPYHEFDEPSPQSVYARSKYEGEKAVRELVGDHWIVRAGWMFGGGPEDKKFVAKMIDLAREREVLRAVDDKVGTPCYTVDISHRVLDLVETGRPGTYHGANAGYCSRFEMAQAIVEFARIDSCRVEPCSSAEFPLPAHRPRLEAIDGLHARLIGMPEQRPWRDALKDYIESVLL
jgi:dTDP-4-dehydrorhamnose reductase